MCHTPEASCGQVERGPMPHSPAPGDNFVQNRAVACHDRRRWAILHRRGAMTKAPVVRSDPQICDSPRFALRFIAEWLLLLPNTAVPLRGRRRPRLCRLLQHGAHASPLGQGRTDSLCDPTFRSAARSVTAAARARHREGFGPTLSGTIRHRQRRSTNRDFSDRILCPAAIVFSP
jgi:hypothetical protein